MKSVVYNSYGVWRFYLSLGQLKMYSPINFEEVILMETKYFFSLCSDNKDNIYIMCQNNYGDIYFITVNGDNVEKTCMLAAKYKNGYEKNFHLINVNGFINAFYMLKHENSNIIIHHIVNSSNQPEIIETIDSYSAMFVTKAEENLYIFYKKENKIMYKIYKWNEKKWIDAEALCISEENIVFINAYVKDKINLVFCNEKKGRYNVGYATKGYKCEIIKNSTTVVYPVICQCENVMHIIFEYGGRMLESTDEEDIISKPKYSYFGTFEKSECVEINTPELNKIYTYGFETTKGIFKPLIIGDVKVKKVTRKTEVKSKLENDIKEENVTENYYEEILKMLDRENEMKILSQIADRLTLLENAVSELVNKMEGMKNGN